VTPLRKAIAAGFVFTLSACAHTPEITLSTIAEECESRRGNVLALKDFSNEISGQTLAVDAMLTRIDSGGMRTELMFMSGDWRLNATASDSVAELLRRGETYHLTGKIAGRGWKGGLGMWNRGDNRCNGDVFLTGVSIKR